MHIRNFKTLFLVFILLSAFAESSIATNWVKVATTNNATLYIDIQSLIRTGSKVQIWDKWVYNKPQELKDASKKTYQLKRELIVFSCDERTAYLLSLIYNADQNPLSAIVADWTRPNTLLEDDNVAPETISENVIELVCKDTDPKK